MTPKTKIKAELISKKGFYVGDVCYQMTDVDYDADWSNDFEDFDGEHEIHGHKFAIGYTSYGDGDYYDQCGNNYGVDAGNIGILPYELCKDKDINKIAKYGRFVKAAKATFTAEDGVFEITFDNDENITIDTQENYSDEDDEGNGYYEGYDDEDGDDDEDN